MNHGVGWRLAAVVLTLGLAGVSPSWAERRIVLPRPGHVGVEVQGGYGTLLKKGELGNDFGNGPALAVRLRYRMRYERAIGISFENDRFEIRVPEAYDPLYPDSLPGRLRMNAVLSGLELYQLFGTRTRTTRMVMVGAGLVGPTWVSTVNKESLYPGGGSFVSAGFGVERFFLRSWALDLSARYMLLFFPEDRLHNIQASLGLMFYVSS